MENIQQILKKERNNENQIYLYKVDDYWFAYERSAFYMFSICCVDAIFKVRDPKEENAMLIAVLKKGMDGIDNPHFSVFEKSDSSLIINCSTTCKGFQHWKDRFIPLVNDMDYVNLINEYYQYANYSYQN